MPLTRYLLRYNLDTKQRAIIANDVPVGNEYEVSDEFVFCTVGGPLQQISLNGSRQIFFNNSNTYFYKCIMFNDGKRLSLLHRNNLNTYIYNIETGQALDSFPYLGFTARTISQDSLFVGDVIFRDSTYGYRQQEGIMIYNYITKKSRLVFHQVRDTSGANTGMDCIKWHPNKRDIYFVQNYSIYRLNTQTQTLTTIRAACSRPPTMSLGFRSFDISADGTKMLAAVYSATAVQTPWQIMYAKYQIWLLDINGNVIKRVL